MFTQLALLVVAGPVATIHSGSPATATADRVYYEHGKIVLRADPGYVPQKTEVDIAWNVASGKIDFEARDNQRTLYVWAPPGRYVIFANVFTRLPDGTRHVSIARMEFRVIARGPPTSPTAPAQPNPTGALSLHQLSRDIDRMLDRAEVPTTSRRAAGELFRQEAARAAAAPDAKVAWKETWTAFPPQLALQFTRSGAETSGPRKEISTALNQLFHTGLDDTKKNRRALWFAISEGFHEQTR